MIARFQVLLPYKIQIKQDSKLQPYDFAYEGYKVTVYPPYQSQTDVASLDMLSPEVSLTNVLDKMRPVANPSLSKLYIDGSPTYQANVFQIDFRRPSFNRSKSLSKKDALSDPPIDLIFKLVNSFLLGLRSIKQASQVKALDPESSCWKLTYLQDDLKSLPREPNKVGFVGNASGLISICNINEEHWLAIQQQGPDYIPHNWDMLIKDSTNLLPDVGPALVLTAIALEVLIATVVDHFATNAKLPTGLWEWINDRKDYRKEPSVEEQFDTLLRVFSKKSLKDNSRLWEVFKNVKEARNAFVHDGRAVLGKKEVSLKVASNLIEGAVEIITWLEEMLPVELRRYRSKQPEEMSIKARDT